MHCIHNVEQHSIFRLELKLNYYCVFVVTVDLEVKSLVVKVVDVLQQVIFTVHFTLLLL